MALFLSSNQLEEKVYKILLLIEMIMEILREKKIQL